MIDTLCTELSSRFLKGMHDREKLIQLRHILRLYGSLHDGLSDMIEEGRLNESHIPDDYRWLADSLTALASRIKQADDAPEPFRDPALWFERALTLLSESKAAWEDEEDSVQEEHAEHIERLSAFFRDWQIHRPATHAWFDGKNAIT